MKANNSRNGKHRKSKVRVNLYMERDIKAVLVYTAAFTNTTLTDLLLDGGLRIAQGKGIIDSNNKVTNEHKDGVSLVKDIINTQEGDK